MIITIDGPSGTGKTTTAKLVAEKLGIVYFDTGAMYRSFAWYLFDKNIPMEEEKMTQKVLDDFGYHVENIGQEKRYIVNGQDITKDIRSPKVTQGSSEVAKFAAVRHHMVHLQRKFAKREPTVMEGRDLGSVVFPHAELKIFLKANPLIRAERRYAQICEKYPEEAAKTSVEEVLEQQAKRDENDTTRSISPLICPEDAREVDTSHLTVDQVVNKIVGYARHIKEKPSLWRRFFYTVMLKMVKGVMRVFYRFEIHGQENIPQGAAILASNHVSFLDPPIVAVCCPQQIHFLARASLFDHFLFGSIIRALNAHPISGGVNDVSLFHEIEKLVLQGKNVAMFPEGRRSRDGSLQPFKRGLGWIVARTHAQVVPVYIEGAFEAWPRRRKFPLLFKKIRCVFGKPMKFPRSGKMSDKAYHEYISRQVFEQVEILRDSLANK